jgi:ribulose-5-phosphate 4-epimerase/fuculose-1-phosphate aldolase
MSAYGDTATRAQWTTASGGYTTADARVDLAAAHRLAVRDNLHEGTWNHISFADPENAAAILISPSYMHWSHVTASSLEHLGPDAELAKRDLALWVAYRIHYPLHQARPDAKCVIHVHSPNVVALSMLGVPLNKAEQSALTFHDQVAYTSEYDGLWPDDLEQGRRMAEVLGERNTVLILRNHGAIVIGATVGRAYTAVYVLERAAQNQILAMSTGQPLNNLSDAQLERYLGKEWWSPVESGTDYFEEHFQAMKRVLDREEPDYRD